MYMSRITMSPTVGAADIARVASADVYADHRLLWSFFPWSVARREFLFRRIDGDRRPSFLVVSPNEPVSPGVAWAVESKPYEPELRVGDALRFSLRANPVVRRRTDDGRQARHDVVMDAKRRTSTGDSAERQSMSTLIGRSGHEWLEGRAGRLGFELARDGVVCTGYRQHRIRRRGNAITFSSVDFDGLLTVTEPAAFTEALLRGIGPSKAFGCGLLLVRRASGTECV
jgi:CRISPR system Cascade subunit CasE